MQRYIHERYSNRPDNCLLKVEDTKDGKIYYAFLSKHNNSNCEKIDFYLAGTGFFTKFPNTFSEYDNNSISGLIDIMVTTLKGKIENPENFKDDDCDRN